MMMDLHRDNGEDDDDSDRTESYTPPPLDITNTSNQSSEKENQYKQHTTVLKEQSIIVLDDSFNQVSISRQDDHEPIDNYWDQWPLVLNDVNNEEVSKLYAIPDVDIPPSPPRPIALSSMSQNNILDILTAPSPSYNANPVRKSVARKAPVKRKKKKKSMSEYRPPSPFSPKPDYKSMDIEQIKKHAMKYGLSTSLSKGRLVKILDEIYNVTHQYETDTDFEFDIDDMSSLEIAAPKKDLSHTPPTPAVKNETKKPKKRSAIHQMSSSDETNDHSPPKIKKTIAISTADNLVNTSQSNEDEEHDDEETNADHEGRFLELTVYELSSSPASSSSLSISNTPPTRLPNLSPSKQSPLEMASQSSTTKKSKSNISTSDSDFPSCKKAAKRPKLETPTLPLKEIVRNYIESNPSLHARVLCYEPVDFEEFHKQMKADLNLKIQSKELMQCLDDQCITFTLRSRKGAFTSSYEIQCKLFQMSTLPPTTISTKKEKNEEQFELEQEFVLRMPPGEYATRLHDLIESGDEKIRERLFIDLNAETRRGRVKFDDTIFKATLYDLPCITESYKTFDRKTIYKIADIAQVLVCRLPGDLSSSEDDDDEYDPAKRSSTGAATTADGDKKKKEKDKEKKYQWPHGLTPPLKNVRKRRFRKVARQKTQDHDEIEKEVRRLFRADHEAIDVKWEIIEDDQEVEINKPLEKDPLEHNDLFGGAVSESDEEDASQKGHTERHHAPSSVDQRTDFDGLFSGDMGELSNMDTTSQANPIDDEHLDQSQWAQQDDLNLDDSTTTGGLSEETRTKLEECQQELYRLNNEKANIDNQLAQMNNPALRNMLLLRARAIETEIERARMEHDQLSNM
ncbi:unnamed protein product [Adineta ricciae]|uniref:Structure-specific endonuclease subunit SLX4 n=1 Tax=Adineta ricciae TaxID=249248 RepID=A0A814L0K8_ADIRI|nr:unnamed protein product [Adineta ricciae]